MTLPLATVALLSSVDTAQVKKPPKDTKIVANPATIRRRRARSARASSTSAGGGADRATNFTGELTLDVED
ncbi:hypothetical protein D3C87_2012860 [compost metagenome]